MAREAFIPADESYIGEFSSMPDCGEIVITTGYEGVTLWNRDHSFSHSSIDKWLFLELVFDQNTNQGTKLDNCCFSSTTYNIQLNNESV